MSFAAELKDFMAGFNAAKGAVSDAKKGWEKRELEEEQRKAREAVDTRNADDAVDPVARRAGTGAPKVQGNDEESGYSASSYGGDPYSGDDSDVANYLDDDDKELAPILNAAFKDGGDWGALTYKKDKSPGGKADLENMTIAEVYGLQGKMLANGHASTAVGGFQTIHDTLKRAVNGLGLDPESTKFDRKTQSKVAAYLARTDGGWDDFKAGKIGKEDVAKRLAGVWAVLPKDASGRGAYDGFNGNRAGVSWNEMSGAITQEGNPRKIAGSDEYLAAARSGKTAAVNAGAPIPQGQAIEVDAAPAAKLPKGPTLAAIPLEEGTEEETEDEGELY